MKMNAYVVVFGIVAIVIAAVTTLVSPRSEVNMAGFVSLLLVI